MKPLKLGEYCNGSHKEAVDIMTDPLDKPPISHLNHQSDFSRGYNGIIHDFAMFMMMMVQ